MAAEKIITETERWIADVVVGCNFCPFASKELKRKTIHFQVTEMEEIKLCLAEFLLLVRKLAEEENIETAFLILFRGFDDFERYLTLVSLAEQLLEQEGYDGIFQLASFHPEYLFARSSGLDAANYTNRSPYPMLHLLREASVTRAIDNYPDTDDIPARNIAFTRAKGLEYMQQLRKHSMNEE